MYDGNILVKERYFEDFNVPQSSSTTNKISFAYSYRYQFKPVLKIVYIRKKSPAEEVGIQEGDILVRLNGKIAYNTNLNLY